MKKIKHILIAMAFLFLLPEGTPQVMAQDASHYETATSEDSGEWGLLGLIGLVGLLGLEKEVTRKKYPP